MQPLSSLADGNRLQRAYHRWAAPRYSAMAPDRRQQAEAIDLFLYTRRGLGFWLGLACAVVGSGLGLWNTGMPLSLALLLGALVWAVLPFALLVAWVQPGLFSNPVHRRKLLVGLALAPFGAVLGFAVGDAANHGPFDPSALLDRLEPAWPRLLQAALLVALVMLGLMWLTAQVRRQIVEHELDRTRLAQERDAAARQAAEAQLKLLQGQIQPHFIFNTLAAVQHWVDEGDPRAGALLRSLSGFLRGSTELLLRERVPFGDELALVRHYLAVMQARLGDRLRVAVDVDEQLATHPLPPGLLLTLVENAVEHGVSPALSGATVQIAAGRAAAGANGWWFSVCDDGAGLPPGWRDGVGLRNTRERLVHAFGPRATLDLSPRAEGGTVVRVELPADAASA